MPISCEWTVPFGRGFFHLGVHNLAPARAIPIASELAAYPAARVAVAAARLLAMLNEDPGTLVVLNHPLWDLAGVGRTEHGALLQAFAVEHRDAVHALELNGYRSWNENSGTIELARLLELPVISGGDRHALRAQQPVEPDDRRHLRRIRDGDSPRAPERGARHGRLPAIARREEAGGGGRRDTSISRAPGRAALLDRSRLVRARRRHPAAVGSLARRGPWWVRSAIRTFEISTRAPLLPLVSGLVWLAGASRSAAWFTESAG